MLTPTAEIKTARLGLVGDRAGYNVPESTADLLAASVLVADKTPGLPWGEYSFIFTT